MCDTHGFTGSIGRESIKVPNALLGSILDESSSSNGSDCQGMIHGSAQLPISAPGDKDLDEDMAMIFKNSGATQSIGRPKGCGQKKRHLYDELNSLLAAVQPPGHCQIPSVGSTAHEQGTCRPCMFNFRAGSCIKGMLCQFCHFGHDRKTRRRGHAGKSKADNISQKNQTTGELEDQSFHVDQNWVQNAMLMAPACHSLPFTKLSAKTWGNEAVSIEESCTLVPDACDLQCTESPEMLRDADFYVSDMGCISL